ncbi:MAG: T9SS type A sorting domain-containing protein [Bacteroidales bacterium]|jgi:hypothetical protein
MKTKVLKRVTKMAFAVIVSLGLSQVSAQTMLYRTDFSPAQSDLSAPSQSDISHGGTGAWQNITGIKVATGNKEAIIPWGADISGLDMIADVPVNLSTIGNYISNGIQQVTGPNGTQVYALYQSVKINNACPPDYGASQCALMIYRGESQTMADPGDVYYTYWFKFPSNLHTQLGTDDGSDNWRVMSEWKTGGSTDYRIITHVHQNTSKTLYWTTEGDGWDNNDNKHIYWGPTNNTTVPVPVGTWFKYEVFWHRSTKGSTDGRYWAAVNGQVIIDYHGSMYPTGVSNPYPINRIFLNNAYSGGSAPIEQWTTGLEIWNGWPCGVGVSCYTPTGLSEKSNQEVFNVYPNPFTTNFTLKISDATILKNAEMKIYDVCGKEVKSVSISSNETIIERGELQSGIYFYSIINNNEKITNGKLIVQ